MDSAQLSPSTSFADADDHPPPSRNSSSPPPATDALPSLNGANVAAAFACLTDLATSSRRRAPYRTSRYIWTCCLHQPHLVFPIFASMHCGTNTVAMFACPGAEGGSCGTKDIQTYRFPIHSNWPTCGSNRKASGGISGSDNCNDWAWQPLRRGPNACVHAIQPLLNLTLTIPPVVMIEHTKKLLLVTIHMKPLPSELMHPYG